MCSYGKGQEILLLRYREEPGRQVKIFRTFMRSVPLYIVRGTPKNVDIEEQYDKIFRFCFGKINNREVAEDLTKRRSCVI